jgi:parallel beta-helix repeat protein
MRKGMFCLTAVCVMLLISASVVEATTITSVPYTITTRGYYTINTNLTSSGDGIIVNASNVTIDLKGYTIVGNGAGSYHGVYMNGRANIEIRNGTVRGFGGNGIYEVLPAGRSHRITNMRVIANKGNGISLSGYNHTVKDCTVSDNGTIGVKILNGIVSGNTVCDNGTRGIDVSLGATVTGNTVSLNGQDGIVAGNGCTVVDNAAYSNTGSGMSVSFGTTLKNNAAYSNVNYGFSLGGHNLVDGNTAYNNTTGNMSSCATCTFGDNHAP